MVGGLSSSLNCGFCCSRRISVHLDVAILRLRQLDGFTGKGRTGRSLGVDRSDLLFRLLVWRFGRFHVHGVHSLRAKVACEPGPVRAGALHADALDHTEQRSQSRRDS